MINFNFYIFYRSMSNLSQACFLKSMSIWPNVQWYHINLSTYLQTCTFKELQNFVEHFLSLLIWKKKTEYTVWQDVNLKSSVCLCNKVRDYQTNWSNFVAVHWSLRIICNFKTIFISYSCSYHIVYDQYYQPVMSGKTRFQAQPI